MEQELFEEPTVPLPERRLREAITILKSLGFSNRQVNESAAYSLLALLDLSPDKSWSEATAPLRGITPIIAFISEAYGVKYAPNTRETIRDDAVKFFTEFGLLLRNPDDPSRPTNSGKTVYQVEDHALELFRSFRSKSWQSSLESYKARIQDIRREIERHRESLKVPVSLPSGDKVLLSPGGQNPLMKAIVEEFCSRFVHDGVVLYLGDTAGKHIYLAKDELQALCVVIPSAAKMPDVIVYDPIRNWLLLIEAVTSAGPVDGKRRKELKELFAECTAGLVFVNAFSDRATLRSFLPDIAWESEVWIAEDPEHLIHFNGERFLGPYPDVMPS